MGHKTRDVEPGDFVAVPNYIEDDELQDLGFTLTNIKQLRNGEFVAGSLLTGGVNSTGGGRLRARAMEPGGDRVPTWRIHNYREQAVLLIPDHLLEVSDGPKAKKYVPIELGIDFYLNQLIDSSLEEVIEGTESHRYKEMRSTRASDGYLAQLKEV